MQQDAVAAHGLLDPQEKRLRRIYPLLLMSTAYKQFWITIVGLFCVFFAALGILAALGGTSGMAPPRAGALPLALLNILVLALVAIAVFFLDLATRRFSIAGGICWLLLAFFGLVPLGFSFELLEPAAGAVDKLIDKLPVQGTLLLLSVIVCVYIPLHYLWVIFRGALALLLAPSAQRKLMREGSPGSTFASRFLIGLWGLPPTVEFVRRPRTRFAGVFALAIVNALCLSSAIMLTLLIALPVVKDSDLSWLKWVGLINGVCDRDAAAPRCTGFANLVLLIGAGAMLFIATLILLGGGARWLMRRLVRVSLEHAQRADPRAPVLFLRAFGDDQVPLKPPRLALLGRLLEIGRRRANLDRMLLEEATPYGPVVALGNPDDTRAPYGAARAYFDKTGWQQPVAELARNAAAILVCIDDTDGIWWEIEHLTAMRHLDKTLFLVHPKHARPEANAKLGLRIAETLRLPQAEAKRLRPVAKGRRGRRQAALLGFYVDAAGVLHALHSSTFSRFAYGLALRQFLRAKPGLDPVAPVVPVRAGGSAGVAAEPARAAPAATIAPSMGG